MQPKKDSYIYDFAKNFINGRADINNTAELVALGKQFNILAVDWYGDASERRFGSDPSNLLGTAEFVRTSGLTLALMDARLSADNGVRDAYPLADKLVNAGAVAENLFLIGHSNGAGFMGSLAAEIYSKTKATGQPHMVAELDALDAPVETDSYVEVARASKYILKVSNYYVSSSGFSYGTYMLSTAGNIVNYDLSGEIINAEFQNKAPTMHQRIPFRYAITAAKQVGSFAWGFQGTDFAKDVVSPIISGKSTESSSSGGFEFQSTTSAFTSDELAQLSSQTVPWSQSIEVGAVSAFDLKVQSTGAGSLLGSNSTLFIHVGTGAAVGTFIYGHAHSPVVASIDVNIPLNASLLRFQMSVLNAGNNDHLLVGLGSNVVGEIDLATQQLLGASTQEYWVGDQAGQTQRLTFYMPSDVPSSAEFILSNIEFVAINHAPTPGAVQDVTVAKGHTLTFTVGATDPEGDAIAYSLADGAPAGMAIDPATGVLTWATTAVDALGTRDVTVVMTDNGPGHLQSYEVVHLTVVNAFAPVLTGSALVTSYHLGDPATVINPTITVSEADSATLASATVRVSVNYSAGEDLLGFVGDATTGNIVGNFDSMTGTMTLTSAGATATVAQFQAALRQVTYRNSNSHPSPLVRSVDFQVFDGLDLSNKITSSVALILNTVPTVTTQPVNTTVTAGTTASFSAVASGSPSPTAQWQSSFDGGVTALAE